MQASHPAGRRLLTVTTSYPRREGDHLGHFIEKSCQEMVARGYRVTVLCPHAAGLPENEIREGIRIFRFRYGRHESDEWVAYGQGIPANIRSHRGSFMPLLSFLYRFRQNIIKHAEDADLIHAHWAPVGWLSLSAVRRFHIPLILSIRGSDLHFGGLPGRWMLKQACRAAERVTCVSDDVKTALEQKGLASETLHVVRNGVECGLDTTAAGRASARDRLGLEADGIYFLSVGRLAPEKNITHLLKAFAHLTRRMGDDLHMLSEQMLATPDGSGDAVATARELSSVLSRCRLICIGDGPERESLQGEAEHLGISPLVRFVGEVGWNDIPQWLHACDAFVLASTREGRPNALLEAMAAGIPCIGTRVGGIPELIANHETGVLVDSGNISEMIGALAFMAWREDKRIDMGRAARQRAARPEYSWGAHGDSLAQLYQQAAGLDRP